MRHSLSHQCPDCAHVFTFSFRMPIFGHRKLVRVLAAYAQWELELAMHTLDHANERIALFLEQERLDAEFVRDEAKRESYTDHD